MYDFPGAQQLPISRNTPVSLSTGAAAATVGDDETTGLLHAAEAAGIGSDTSSDEEAATRRWYRSVEQSSSDCERSCAEANWDPYLESCEETANPTGVPSGGAKQSAGSDGSSQKRRKQGNTELSDLDLLDITFMQPDQLAGALANQGDHVMAIKVQGLWLWKIQFATMPTEERPKLEADLYEELQGRSMAECVKFFRRVLQEFEKELFHAFILEILQKRLPVSSSRV